MNFKVFSFKEKYNNTYKQQTGVKLAIVTEDQSEKGGFGYIKYMIDKLYGDCDIDLIQCCGADNIEHVPEYLRSIDKKYDKIVIIFDSGRQENTRADFLSKARTFLIQALDGICDCVTVLNPVCFEEILQQTYNIKDVQDNKADGEMLKTYRELFDGNIDKIDYNLLGKDRFEQTEQFIERMIEQETLDQKYKVRHRGGIQKCWMTECSKCRARYSCVNKYDKCKYIQFVNKSFMYFIIKEIQEAFGRKYLREYEMINILNNKDLMNKIVGYKYDKHNNQ